MESCRRCVSEDEEHDRCIRKIKGDIRQKVISSKIKHDVRSVSCCCGYSLQDENLTVAVTNARRINDSYVPV